jgi:hypothetical protein
MFNSYNQIIQAVFLTKSNFTFPVQLKLNTAIFRI